MKKLFTLIIMAGLAFTTQAQNITNTLGATGKLEVKTSGGVEALTVTDGSQVIISNVASPTPKTGVILDLNSTDKTLQFPMLSFNTYVGVTAHGAGRMFWDSDNNRFGMFYGTDILDFARIIDSRDGPASLKYVQGNPAGTSIYIGLDAGNGYNSGAGPNNGDQENVAFGHDALYSIGTADGTGSLAEQNTAIGGSAGYNVTTGQGNTALGFTAGVTGDAGGGELDYTTAIGYGAITTADNQIMLGRTVDHVVIPGKANIRDVLNLKPMSAAPSSPVNGDLYVNSTDNHIYCYLGGVWKQLD
ncbi:hypothetical protein GFJ94_01810 [Flavobacterium sp. LMO8]|uniref:hypothetical protein n=1 Tax=Flavobacterium sp. LMO8 TaxID=2654244 RepID=UPI001290EA1F|nr:hypothetical protein [Flavobacterium sp. LMO8]MQP23795.1 hypothetical protein [Flavobacterium sp. LMO8]